MLRGRGAALKTTQGQFDGFFSQLSYKCHLPEVASVEDWLKICPRVASRVGGVEADLQAQLRRLSPRGALPTGPPLSAKKRSYPHTGSACIYPTLTLSRSSVADASAAGDRSGGADPPSRGGADAPCAGGRCATTAAACDFAVCAVPRRARI